MSESDRGKLIPLDPGFPEPDPSTPVSFFGPYMTELFLSRVRVSGDCWEWTGRDFNGYGQHGALFVHRIAAQIRWGMIPRGYEVDHLCLNTGCCNPAHLEIVTPEENSRRAGPTIAASAHHTAKREQTHCKRGHPLSGDNLYASARGRACKACARIRTRTLRVEGVAVG